MTDNAFVTASLTSAAGMTLWRFLPVFLRHAQSDVGRGLSGTAQTLDPFYIGLLTGLAVIFIYCLGNYAKPVKRITYR